MNKFFTHLCAITVLGMTLTSCETDNAKEIFNTSYTFERNGKSTVNYEGQNIRHKMVKEIVEGLKNNDYSYNRLNAMLSHQAGNQDFEDISLNQSEKNVKSKIAVSEGLFSNHQNLSIPLQEEFSQFIREQKEVMKNKEQEANAGIAGSLLIGSKTRYINEKGIEVDQLFKKGIIGGLMLDQALNHYLVKVKKDRNEAGNEIYTPMEHHWDEAFGYLFGGGDEYVKAPNAKGEFPNNNEFIKYANALSRNPHFKGFADGLFNDFVTGRKAIVDKRYEVRDRTIQSIQEKASKVVAIRAVFYLMKSAEQIDAGTAINAFHGLSEALGFIYTLQFTHNPATGEPYFSHEEVNELIALFKENQGLWSVSKETVERTANKIAERFGFSVEQAKADAPE